MKNLIQVDESRIRNGLLNRFNEVNELRGGEIYEKAIDQLIDTIIDCGGISGTPEEIIDNRLINGERYTYEEIYNRYLRDEKEYYQLNEEEKEEAIEEIHDYIERNYFGYYNDDLEEFVSF